LKRGIIVVGVVLICTGIIGFNIVPTIMTGCESYIGDQRKYFAKDLPPKCMLAQVVALMGGIVKINSIKLLELSTMILIVIGIALIADGVLLKSKPKITTQSDQPKVEDSQDKAEPYDILKKRLAKGEITKEEFDELRKRL